MATFWQGRCARAVISTILLCSSLIVGSARVAMAEPSCATPVSHGELPIAADCLFILRAAIGAATCIPECACSPTGGETISATDALLCMRAAVGQPFLPACDCPPTTTSTTLPPVTGECEFSGVECQSRFDCEEACFAACAAPWNACYAEAAAGFETCFAKCAADDQTCLRLCVLYRDTIRVSCDRFYQECSPPCDDELCDGLHQGPRFEDTGLTVIDHQTQLEWEKKTAENVGARYTWSKNSTSTRRNGTAFTEFLLAMNDPNREGGCYAGRCDWRLPTTSGDGSTGKQPEMESIVKFVHCPDRFHCVDPLLGPVSRDFYWSATTVAPASTNAWGMYFVETYPRTTSWPKFFASPARAVRDIR
jgi:hypothetical protein